MTLTEDSTELERQDLSIRTFNDRFERRLGTPTAQASIQCTVLTSVTKPNATRVIE